MTPQPAWLSQTKHSLSEETAWAAGLFEGEGSVYLDAADVRKRNGKLRIGMSLSSTDEDVVRRFHAALGAGKVYGPYHAKRGTKVYWAWQLRNADLVAIAYRELAPHLGLRRVAAFETALETYAAADAAYKPKRIGAPTYPWSDRRKERWQT